MVRKSRKSRNTTEMEWSEDIWDPFEVHLGWREVRRSIVAVLWWILKHLLWLQYLNPLHYLYRRYQKAVIIDSEGTVLYRPPITDVFLSEFRRQESIISWAGDQIPTLQVCDLSITWSDGIAVCALLEAVRPGACPRYDLLKSQNKIKNCRLALRLAHKYLGIPQTIITPEEMALEVPREYSVSKMMSLLTLIRASASQSENLPVITRTLRRTDSSKTVNPEPSMLWNFESCTAKGTGLVAGVVGKMCKYNVFMNTRESIDLRIEILGPENDCCLEKIVSVNPDDRRPSWVEKQGAATINFLGLGGKKTVVWKQDNGTQNAIVRKTQNGNNVETRKTAKIPFDYQCISEGHVLITFIPRNVGIHLVRMHWHNKEIRGSPFSVNIVKSIEMLHEKSREKASVKAVSFGSDAAASLDSDKDGTQEGDTTAAGATETAVLAHSSKIHRTIGTAALRLTKQATITRRRVLRRVITKAGQEIVIHETPSIPGSPCESPSREKPILLDRPGSPAPKKLPNNGSSGLDEFGSELPTGKGTPNSGHVENEKVSVGKFAEIMCDAILEDVYVTIGQKNSWQNDEVEDSSSELSGYATAPETVDPRRDSLQPPQFDVNFTQSPFTSRSPEHSSRGQSCEEKRAQFKKEKDSEGSNLVSVYAHENVKRVIATRSVTMNPSLNFNAAARLGIPSDETIFKSSPFSRSNSPFGRSRRDEDSESCTSESDSIISFDPRSSIRGRRSPSMMPPLPGTTSDSSSDRALDLSFDLSDSFHYLADIEEKLRVNIKNEQQKKSSVTVRTQIGNDRQSKMVKAALADASDDCVGDSYSESMERGTTSSIGETLPESTTDQLSTTSTDHSSYRHTEDSSDMVDSWKISEEDEADFTECGWQSESFETHSFPYNQRALGTNGDSTVYEGESPDVQPLGTLTDDGVNGNAVSGVLVKDEVTDITEERSFTKKSEYTLDDPEDDEIRSTLHTKSQSSQIGDFSYDQMAFGTGGDSQASGNSSLVNPPCPMNDERDQNEALVGDLVEDIRDTGEESQKPVVKTKLTISTSLPIMSRRAAFEFDPDDTISVDEMARLSSKMRVMPKRASYANGESIRPPEPFALLSAANEQNNSTLKRKIGTAAEILGRQHEDKGNEDSGSRLVTSDRLGGEESPMSFNTGNEPAMLIETAVQAHTSVQSSESRCAHQPMANEADTTSLRLEDNTLTLKAPKAKVTRWTQVAYSEIKSATGWDKTCTHFTHSPFPTHTSPPHALSGIRVNVQRPPNDDQNYSFSVPTIQPFGFQKHVGDNVAYSVNGNLRPNQPYMKLPRSSLPVRQSTVDSGIQDDRGSSPLNYSASPRRSLDFTVPVRQHPTFQNGHRVVARCTNSRLVSIDQSLLNAGSLTPSADDHESKVTSNEHLLSSRWKVPVSRLNRSSSLNGRWCNKEGRSLAKLKRQMGVHRKRVTFSRSVMMHRRSSSKSSRNSSGKQSGSSDSYTMRETDGESRANQSVSEGGFFETEMRDTTENKVENWLSFTDRTSVEPTSAFQLMSNTSSITCKSLPLSDTNPVVNKKPHNSPLSSVAAAFPELPSTFSPKTTASLDDNYCGFGVPLPQREGFLSELNFFRNLDNSNSRNDIHSSLRLQLEPSSSSDTCSEVAGLTENLETSWSRLGKIQESTQHIDIAAWLDSAIASSPKNQEVPNRHGHGGESNVTGLPKQTLNGTNVGRTSPVSTSSPFHKPNAAKCRASGAGLHSGFVSTSNNFQVQTDDAGHGNLSVSVSGTRQYDVIRTDVIYTGDNLYEVIFEVKYPGTYVISVKWSEVNIPDSPFICSVGI